MSKWSDGSDRACANFTKFANLQKDRLGYLCLMIGGNCLFRSLLLLLEHWNSQELAGTRRDSQGLAGTRRDSQELAGNTGTRRNLQGLAGTLELSNTGTLLLLGRLAWLMVGEGGRA